METKHWTKSRTMQFGAAVTFSGVLLTALAIFDALGSILDAIDVSMLPEDVAAWIGVGVVVVGAIIMILRRVTSQPIAGTKAAAVAKERQ